MTTSRRSLWVFAVLPVFVAACNSIVGNDSPKLRTAVVTGDAGIEAGSTGPRCAGDEKACFGTCVPKFSSGFSCASETSCDPCPQHAHATPICNGAVCAAECKKGYENCDTASPDCETDLASASTCGGCNVKCDKFCSPDSAGSFKCTETCETGLKECGSKCVDTQSSPKNCGACDNLCPEPTRGTATCQNGQCSFDCDEGFHRCGDKCVSDTNVNACGASCTACATAVPPNMVPTCNRGVCENTCALGFADCDGDPKNGCEADILSSSVHCGTCFNQCSGGIIYNDIDPLYRPIPPSPGEPLCCLQGSCVGCNTF